MKLLLATRNRDKVDELRVILAGLPLELVSLGDLEDAPEVEEDGDTFEENALKKARAAHGATGLPTCAEDSGLEVDFLHGGPGVWSARYAGPEQDYAANNRKLLEELYGVPEARRTARFVCAAALVGAAPPAGGRPLPPLLFRGEVHGRITTGPRGESGFGYDPVFLVPEEGRTFAEMPREHKNEISHRAQAFRQVRLALKQILAAGKAP